MKFKLILLLLVGIVLTAYALQSEDVEMEDPSNEMLGDQNDDHDDELNIAADESDPRPTWDKIEFERKSYPFPGRYEKGRKSKWSRHWRNIEKCRQVNGGTFICKKRQCKFRRVYENYRRSRKCENGCTCCVCNFACHKRHGSKALSCQRVDPYLCVCTEYNGGL